MQVRVARFGIFVLGLICLLTALAPAMPAQAQVEPVIREIRVEGIERIEPETVRSYIPMRAGERYDPSKVDGALKSLFATGLFADVSIRREGDIVIVKVVENPIISRLAFEGNDIVDDETLRAEVQLRPRVVYTRTRVQNDVKRIIDLYNRQGRFAVSVEPKVIQRDQNRVDLVFEIDEGEPTLIRTISFVGNEAFTDSRLRSVVSSAETRWYSFLTADDIYDPDRMSYDQELLRKHYLENGYADFQVLSANAELSSDRRDFFLTFTVEEGERYKFGKVSLTNQLERLDPELLRPAITFKEGDWYSVTEVEKTINAMTDAAGDLGFAFIEIRPNVDRDRENHVIAMNFEVSEGPRVFVERIDIRGNVRTEDRVIRREFRLVEGDAFNAARYRLSQQRVRDLRYFKNVTFDRKQGSAPDKVILDVEVEEQSTGSFSIGAGVSSTDGLLTQLQLTERNLLGKGQRLNFTTSVGTKSQQFDVSFTEPYFLERRLAATANVFNMTRKKTDSISFEQSRTGAGVDFGFYYNERLSQNVGYSLESKEISDVDNTASLFVRQQEGTAITSQVSQSLAYDTRDSRVDPTSGFLLQLKNDLAGFGGDNRFLRTTLTGTYFQPLIYDWIGRFSAETGYILGLGEDIRIDERYFIGGDSFRGFAQGGIGPRDAATGDALGGNQYVTAQAEVGIPLGNASSYQTRGFIFSDVGTLMDVDDSGAGIQEDDMLRMSLGIGIGVKTPFGLVRINVAQPVLSAAFDKKEVFSFRFGTSF